MATKKTTNKTNKTTKATSGTKKKSTSPISQKESQALARAAEKEMKRLGFKTLEEYIEYIDNKRGY